MYSNVQVLRNKVIRHIENAICHMWRVANGLENAALECHILLLEWSPKTRCRLSTIKIPQKKVSKFTEKFKKFHKTRGQFHQHFTREFFI